MKIVNETDEMGKIFNGDKLIAEFWLTSSGKWFLKPNSKRKGKEFYSKAGAIAWATQHLTRGT